MRIPKKDKNRGFTKETVDTLLPTADYREQSAFQ